MLDRWVFQSISWIDLVGDLGLGMGNVISNLLPSSCILSHHWVIFARTAATQRISMLDRQSSPVVTRSCRPSSTRSPDLFQLYLARCDIGHLVTWARIRMLLVSTGSTDVKAFAALDVSAVDLWQFHEGGVGAYGLVEDSVLVDPLEVVLDFLIDFLARQVDNGVIWVKFLQSCRLLVDVAASWNVTNGLVVVGVDNLIIVEFKGPILLNADISLIILLLTTWALLCCDHAVCGTTFSWRAASGVLEVWCW